MEIPRHWRQKKQRYTLEGLVCLKLDCKRKIFPPRPICPDCHSETSIHPSRKSGEVYVASTTAFSPKEVSSSSK